MKVISFVSQKGGAGKTTLVINCAVAASSVGNRVLILDVDKQKSAEIWYQKREVQEPILVVAGPSSLANAIDKARNVGINTVFIDTPGHDSPGTADAIKVSDLWNWLQVLTCAKLSKVNECEGDEFEAEMIFLFCLKA